MKFGFGGVNVTVNIDHFQDAVTFVQFCEALGYDYAWFSDRVRDTYAMGTAAALNTRKIRLGVGVANPFTRHPIVLARGIATLDEISGGRAVLGLGTGNIAEWVREMGFEGAKAYARVGEALYITKRLLAGEAVTFNGSFFKLDGLKLGMKTRSDIPIYVAGNGPKILGVAGELSDGALVAYAEPALLKMVRETLRGGAEKAGRSPSQVEMVAWMPMYVTDDAPAVRDFLRGFAAMQMLLSPFKWLNSGLGVSEEAYETIRRGYAKGAHVDPKLELEYIKKAKEQVKDEWVDAYAVIGNLEEVCAKVEAIQKAGVSFFVVWVPTPAAAEKRKVMEGIAEKVIPRFR